MAILIDPAKVLLLLHGGSPIVDSGLTPKTLTPNSVVSSAAQSVFGGSSLYSDGTSHLTTPAHSDFDFGTEDFTILCRVRRSSGFGRAIFFGQASSAAGENSASILLQINASDKLSAYAIAASTYAVIGATTATASVSNNTWYTVEYSRSGSTFRLRVDGVTVATATSALALNSSTYKLGVLGLGEYTSGLRLMGFIDELLVYAGVLHASDYTPETEGFGLRLAYLSGVVRDASGAPAARAVTAWREDTKALAGSAVSDATTGAYSIDLAAGGTHSLVFYPSGGEALNALVLRGVAAVEV